MICTIFYEASFHIVGLRKLSNDLVRLSVSFSLARSD